MDKENKLFNITLDKLIEQAVEDGVISDDEMEVIKQVEIDAKEYSILLKEAQEDGIITKDEAKKLNDYKQKIIEQAKKTTEKDDTLTQEEHDLLIQLMNIISSHYKNY